MPKRIFLSENGFRKLNESFGDDSIKAVLFDFDFTLFDTSVLDVLSTEFIRTEEGMNQALSLIPNIRMYQGIKELIHYIVSNGIKYGIVSNRNEGVIAATLKHFGLGVEIVIGERPNCPKSIRMKEACSKLGVEPGNAIYVGDSPWDNAESMKAGVTFIGATWGNKLLKMGYNSPEGVVKYIEYMNE